MDDYDCSDGHRNWDLESQAKAAFQEWQQYMEGASLHYCEPQEASFEAGFAHGKKAGMLQAKEILTKHYEWLEPGVADGGA